MKSAAIYAFRSQPDSCDRESLIFNQLDSALKARAELDRHELGACDPKAPSVSGRSPGLATVRPREPIVALGCAAHAALADFEKRTLIIGDLDLGGPQEQLCVPDIDEFVWSCANTLRMVALGRGAWHSAQLLPVADRRFHNVPPLRIASRSMVQDRILVINHGDEEMRARALVDLLEHAGMGVEYYGRLTHDGGSWASDALIHVHVGDHTLDAEELRLVDGWRSERLVLQLAYDRHLRHPSTDVLAIENEVNGILCETPEDVASACRELFDDRVLRQKLIASGQATIAPLMKGWGAVADDLLA